MMAEWDLDAFAARLPDLKTPLLLVHGDRDAAIPARAATEAAALVPGTSVRHLPGLARLPTS